MRLAIFGNIARTRTVAVTTDMSVMITDNEDIDNLELFKAQIYPARNPKGNPTDASPRATAPRSLVWVDAGVHPESGPINCGDRIYTAGGGIEHEITKGPIARRAGLRILAWEYEAIPVGVLYPLLAQLSDLGGAVVEAGMPMAVWEGQQSNQSRGSYDNLNGEAPPEFYNALKVVNREVVIGSRPMRIVSAMLHTSEPHVKLELRDLDA